MVADCGKWNMAPGPARGGAPAHEKPMPKEERGQGGGRGRLWSEEVVAHVESEREVVVHESPGPSTVQLSSEEVQVGAAVQVIEEELETVIQAMLQSTEVESHSEQEPEIRAGGAGIFEAITNCSDCEKKDFHLLLVVEKIMQLQQISSYMTVVVMSDDSAFLAAFVELSLKLHILVWSTRLLIVTRSHIKELQDHQAILSKTNSVLVVINEDTANARCSVYVYLPYSPRGVKPLQVASWTPHRGLVFTSSLPLFPDKFSKLFHGPKLLLTAEENIFNKIKTPSTKTSTGSKVQFRGSGPQLVDYLSEALNFSYSYVRPPDGEGGIKLNNGSWSGMVGMVMRQEVDIGAGPYMIDRWRAEVVDFTVPILIDYWRILAARGRPEVDPWGFLFPLTPLVWAAILAALMVLATLVFLMSSSVFNRIHEQRNWLQVTFVYVRILLQQDMAVPICWWERVMLLVWIMVTLVLTRSYAGNLMALLAVRHISQPYQTLRDVVDDPSVTMIWSKGSAVGPYLKSAESGIYRDIADAEKVGRLIWKAHPQFPEVIDTLVRRGDHVLIEVDTPIRDYLAQDFTKTGQCYFYESREEFLKIMFAMIGPKDSPLVPALNKRIMSMTEAGLFFQWLKIEEKNSTTCYRAPNKITVNMALSISNVWGMFVILIMGYFLSVCVFCLELLIHRLPQQVQKFPHEHNF
ncbi:probable glutamate receptor [Cherax quadricarinatus]|uniref:probable glutamate receptor n=1 Tax=Cherax quadricarinatus TaxID=27406 RepID=UPI00387E44F1